MQFGCNADQPCTGKPQGDNCPQLADLRESGVIERMPTWYEEVYRPDHPDLVGMPELIIAKQRNGPTGIVKVRLSSDQPGLITWRVRAGPRVLRLYQRGRGVSHGL